MLGYQMFVYRNVMLIRPLVVGSLSASSPENEDPSRAEYWYLNLFLVSAATKGKGSGG